MFLSNLNSFNSSPLPLDQGFSKRKSSSKVWKEKGSKWLCHCFSLSLFFFFFFALLMCFAFVFWVSLVLRIVSFNMFLFVYFLVLLYFFFVIKKIEKKSEKYKNSVCLCTLVLVYLGWPLKQIFSKLCIFCNLNEYFYA